MRCVVMGFALLTSMLFSTPAPAQITPWSTSAATGPHAKELRLSVFGSLALPQGSFRDATSSDAWFAQTGAGLGLEGSALYAHGLEVGLLLLADRHPIDASAFERTLTTLSGGIASPAQITAKRWLVSWGGVQVGYAPDPGRDLHPSISAVGGLFVASGPDARLGAASGKSESVQYNQVAIGPAAGAEASLRWRRHAKLGLVYLTGTTPQTTLGPNFVLGRKRISTLHVTLGYEFGR